VPRAAALFPARFEVRGEVAASRRRNRLIRFRFDRLICDQEDPVMIFFNRRKIWHLFGSKHC
jgi:hypothetical protein